MGGFLPPQPYRLSRLKANTHTDAQGPRVIYHTGMLRPAKTAPPAPTAYKLTSVAASRKAEGVWPTFVPKAWMKALRPE